jgi:hypothetical protein
MTLSLKATGIVFDIQISTLFISHNHSVTMGNILTEAFTIQDY